MSRELPAYPSLEYLRKQAKQLQRTMPEGRLDDAQHALAREYGFANWARLKSCVVILGLSPAEALTAPHLTLPATVVDRRVLQITKAEVLPERSP